ncbi:MAG TPA: 4Fe-4S dicluster domain-containing protein [candidate division Zixibacteria bacterium]|nr:4Fe-4S dicluster domain-containing protein [candidate division Zixibacteria bacterium]
MEQAQVKTEERRVIINLDRCIGCSSCRVACSRTHQTDMNLTQAFAEPVAAFPAHCRHCENPACAAACPKDAILKCEDGIVRRFAFRCIGCKSCSIACPFGAIQPEHMRNIIMKCDLCYKRLDEGQLPACVTTCVSGALSFEDPEKVIDGNLAGARIKAKPGMRRW